MYRLARSALFQLSAETAHEVSLDCLAAAGRIGLMGLVAPKLASQPVQVMGLQFPNAIGLAAGMDKNGDCIDALGHLGFGHLELGTVTPKPQAGNPKPRLFRLRDAEGIINRMGFNNKGVDYLVDRIKASKYTGVLGINIGKNKDTAEADALSDYQYCLRKAWPVADYITVNLSSPNTPGLRDLQFGEPLERLMNGLAQTRQELQASSGRQVPIAVKLAPDMSDEDLVAVAEVLIHAGMDAIVATNTTLSRQGVAGMAHAEQAGGLSGQPLYELSNQKLSVLVQAVRGRVPIIGVGGVASAEQAVTKLKLGASLVQIYSGFIYHGPGLIKEAVLAADGFIRAKP